LTPAQKRSSRARSSGASSVFLALGDPPDPQRPHQAVDRQTLVAGHLRHPPLDDAAVEVHLEEPILPVAVALGEVEILALLGLDVRDAPAVAPHPHPPVQLVHLDRPLHLWQRPPGQPMPENRRSGCGQPDRGRAGDQPRLLDPFPAPAHGNCVSRLASWPK
jgi:hypothetical protein